MTNRECDVVIIGGGLSGLTLSLQIRRAMPELSVHVLERSKLPPPASAHKVGESTVEIGAHYLARSLNLGELLETTQLRKFGLRLFFGAGNHNDLAHTDELGASRLLPAVSYQIDRGRLEADLADIVIGEGVSLHDKCLVRRTRIDDGGGRHVVEYEHGGEREYLESRWIIDAGGRSAPLKRSLGIGLPCKHQLVAAWLRLDSAIAVDDWSSSPSWRDRCARPRRLSTNHLMGPGYWVWIIPLVGGRTSLGIVAEPEAHPMSTLSSFEKVCSWLARHQPLLAAEVHAAKHTLMDFRFMRNLARDSREVWSRDRWALTGESGLFSDPFYSPGSDFIGISNTFICDLLQREKSGDRFASHTTLYQRIYKSFFASTMSLYEDQYGGFADTRLMVVKTTWDYAYYWSILSWLYFRGLMTDGDFLGAAQSRLVAMRRLNERMQKAFRARAAERRQDAGHGRFFDQAAIPVLRELNAALLEPTANPARELEDNCATLERLAPTLVNLLENESAAGTCGLIGDLRQRFN